MSMDFLGIKAARLTSTRQAMNQNQGRMRDVSESKTFRGNMAYPDLAAFFHRGRPCRPRSHPSRLPWRNYPASVTRRGSSSSVNCSPHRANTASEAIKTTIKPLDANAGTLAKMSTGNKEKKKNTMEGIREEEKLPME